MNDVREISLKKPSLDSMVENFNQESEGTSEDLNKHEIVIPLLIPGQEKFGNPESGRFYVYVGNTVGSEESAHKAISGEILSVDDEGFFECHYLNSITSVSQCVNGGNIGGGNANTFFPSELSRRDTNLVKDMVDTLSGTAYAMDPIDHYAQKTAQQYSESIESGRKGIVQRHGAFLGTAKVVPDISQVTANNIGDYLPQLREIRDLCEQEIMLASQQNFTGQEAYLEDLNEMVDLISEAEERFELAESLPGYREDVLKTAEETLGTSVRNDLEESMLHDGLSNKDINNIVENAVKL